MTDALDKASAKYDRVFKGLFHTKDSLIAREFCAGIY